MNNNSKVKRKEIDLPKGTHVGFKGDSQVYTLAYRELLGPCARDCTLDHDHYTEAYVAVNRVIGTALPLSRLEIVFDLPGNRGREYTPKRNGGNMDGQIHSLDARLAFREGDPIGCDIPGPAQVVTGTGDCEVTCEKCDRWLGQQPMFLTEQGRNAVESLED